MFKRIIASTLTAVMLIGVMAGCGGKTEADTQSQENAQTTGPVEETAPNAEIAITVNGVEIDMGTFNYFVKYYVGFVQKQLGTVEDWTMELQEGYSLADYVKDGAIDSCTSFGAIARAAKELKVEITEEDEAKIDAQWENIKTQYPTDEELDKFLEENALTAEILHTLGYYSELSDKLFVMLYGADGADLSDEECAEYVENDGYLMAKHILLSTKKTDDDGNSVDMDETEKAEVLAKANELIAQLDACATQDEMLALFDTLVRDNSEDPGSLAYPGGYLFQEGDMVPEFFEGTKALNINEHSGPIETSYGYHIILRLPIDFNSTPSSYSRYGYNYSLRFICANNMFNAVRQGWIDTSDTVISKEVEDMDVLTMIG